MDNFSQYELQTPTNQDLEITFTPEEGTFHYEYRVITDDHYGSWVSIENGDPITILLDQTGENQIEVITYDKEDHSTLFQSGTYKIDKEAPKIHTSAPIITFEVGTEYNFLEDLTVEDNFTSNLILTDNLKEIDLQTPGEYTIVFEAVDEAGNKAVKKVPLTIEEAYSNQLFVIQNIIFLTLCIFAFLILKFQKSIRLEKRFTNFSVEPLKDRRISMFDHLSTFYVFLVKKISKAFQKSVFLGKYAKHYEKYVGVANKDFSCGMDFIASKTIVSLLFIFIAIFDRTIQLQLLHFYEFCFPMIVGFFMPDIIYIYKYKLYRKQLEADLLDAIIIMNNAFKSGRSITQALEIVAEELKGPIAKEFHKMYLEMSFGLYVDVVFQRFQERMQLEEITYLTASLSILNHTGGNIVKVFSSIEKSLFNRQKLRLEAKALTSSSRVIVWALFLVPLLFVLVIQLINPGYFAPFFASSLGLLLFFLVLLLYGLYIWIVRKIMKVRM